MSKMPEANLKPSEIKIEKCSSLRNRITQEEVDAFIESVQFKKMGDKTCVAVAKLKNGFEICESASCVDAANYDPDVGAALALHRIKDKVWVLLGFLLQTKLAESKANAAVKTE
jgi:hypothetical protein